MSDSYRLLDANTVMCQLSPIKCQEIFLSNLKAITSRKSYPITQISGNTLLKKIALLEGDNLSVEKLVIERILSKDVVWFDFLWLVGLFDNIQIDQGTVISLFADSICNACNRILRIVEIS
ncbi:MAG: hypothetical protein ACXAD7_14895 [Candidatus Kariarchaeaceae archaeon]|jgi:hypothetical protein